MTVSPPSRLLPFLTSAPGKVILFGEHSAVYNQPAIAASVSSLRTYLYVCQYEEDPNAICMDFPDLDFQHSWSHSEFKSVPKEVFRSNYNMHELLHKGLLDALDAPLSQLQDPLARHAAVCFLYLYMCLCPELKGVRFVLKSTLPIGAGLGSSASIAVCLSLAMAKLGGHINSNATALTLDDMNFINQWSLIGEKCIHGTPSGIDNAVATFGGAVLFRKETTGQTSFEPIDNFPQIPMILTNTKIPKSTKALVANVKKLVDKEPEVTSLILRAMGKIAANAMDVFPMIDSDSDAYSKLLELVRLNHGLLVSLGVSHPGLETIKILSDSSNIGSTKLTGAGGGGCAVTILHKSTTQEEINSFKDHLKSKYDYDSFTTDLGGIGCCFLPAEAINTCAEQISKLFNSPTTTQQLTDCLLPGSSSSITTSNLSWIHNRYLN